MAQKSIMENVSDIQQKIAGCEIAANKLIATNKRLRDALQEIRDMHDGEEDVIDDERGPKPNRAMRVNQIIDAVL
jgi:hypothetical protein